MKDKILNVRRKGYFGSESKVKLLTYFFPVSKTWKEEGGENLVDEIRMVYDATQSGLDDTVWAPWFAMPTVESYLQVVEAGKFMVDCDMGEMFLNFMLEPSIRLHSGVDLSKRFPEEGVVSRWMLDLHHILQLKI